MLVPLCAGNTIKIPDHDSVADGQLADEAAGAAEAGAEDVGEAEVPGFNAQDGDVGGRAHGEMALGRRA